MKASVVIPTHNRHQKLETTLASLRRQTIGATHYEIIVVDDGSTPPVSLASHEGSPKCRVVRLEGAERSAARNAGASAGVGKLVIFVDDDIEVCPDFVEAHIKASTEWKQGLAVGEILLPEEELSHPFGRFRAQLERSTTPKDRGPVLARNFCAAGNMSVDRERFLQLGGFDVNMTSGEDQDFALRHSSAGGRNIYIPEAAGIHWDGAMDIRTYCQRYSWGASQIIPFCRKYPEWPENVWRERVNGPIRFGTEPLLTSARKVLKAGASNPVVTSALFKVARFLERWAPETVLLERTYKLLLGAHIFRGYREGLRLFRDCIPAELDNQKKQVKAQV